MQAIKGAWLIPANVCRPTAISQKKTKDELIYSNISEITTFAMANKKYRYLNLSQLRNDNKRPVSLLNYTINTADRTKWHSKLTLSRAS
jgi:hypothetical protein